MNTDIITQSVGGPVAVSPLIDAPNRILNSDFKPRTSVWIESKNPNRRRCVVVEGPVPKKTPLLCTLIHKDLYDYLGAPQQVSVTLADEPPIKGEYAQLEFEFVKEL
jgi:hypothetical protein